MNANASAMATPSFERYCTATSKFARGDITCFARMPLSEAGERRNVFAGTSPKTEGARPCFQETRVLLHGWRRMQLGMKKLRERPAGKR